MSEFKMAIKKEQVTTETERGRNAYPAGTEIKVFRQGNFDGTYTVYMPKGERHYLRHWDFEYVE